nr:PREDICTED: DEP domain-containing protein 1A-like [Bemisia tabaci]
MERSGPYRATKLWNEAICIFKKGMPVKRHRRHMKYYDGTFTGIEAVNWFHAALLKTSYFGPDVTRDQVVRLLDKFLKANVFTSIKTTNRPFKEGAELYQFVTEDESSLKNRSLNSEDSKIFNGQLRDTEKGGGKLAEIGKMEFENILWRSMFLRRLNLLMEGVDLKSILPMSAINCNYLVLNCKYMNVGANFPQWVLEAINTLLLFDWPMSNIGHSPTYPGFETDIVEVIKDYFNSLSDPLIPFQFYNVFVCAYQYLDSLESRRKMYSTNQHTMPYASRSTENLILGMSSPLKKGRSSKKKETLRNREFHSSNDSLLNEFNILSGSLPRNSCFETAFTSDSPTTRIVPKSAVDTIHLAPRKSTSSFPGDASDQCETERMELKPLKPLRRKIPSQPKNQPEFDYNSDTENVNPHHNVTQGKKYYNRHPPPDRQTFNPAPKCPSYDEAIKSLTFQRRLKKKLHDTNKESFSTLPKLIRKHKAEAMSNKNMEYEYPQKNLKYFSIAQCDNLSDDFKGLKTPFSVSGHNLNDFPCHDPKYKKINKFSSQNSLDDNFERPRHSANINVKNARKNSLFGSRFEPRAISKSMERLASVDSPGEVEFNYGIALETLNRLMECSRSTTPDSEQYLTVNDNSSFYTDSDDSDSSYDGNQRRKKKSGWSDETVNSGKKIFQLLCLLLPPKNRAQLKLLLLLMSRLMASPHSQVLYELSQGVMRENNINKQNDLAFFVVCFLLDHKDILFKPPLDFVNEIRSKARKCLNSSRKNHAYCERVSTEEFEQQRFTGSQRALAELLDQILHDQKMNAKEKKRKLKMFQEAYPEIYSLKCPLETESKSKSTMMGKFPSLSKLKQLRI